MYSRAIILGFILFLAAGCAATFPEATLSDVDSSVTYEKLSKDPEAYKGKKVVFGGIIASIENREGETFLEIVQLPLDRSKRPTEEISRSGGRFIAVFESFLDPVIYTKGLSLTVVGRVTGVSTRPLGKSTYRYPLIKADTHRLFPRERRSPRLHFGIGVGTTF